MIVLAYQPTLKRTKNSDSETHEGDGKAHGHVYVHAGNEPLVTESSETYYAHCTRPGIRITKPKG